MCDHILPLYHCEKLSQVSWNISYILKKIMKEFCSFCFGPSPIFNHCLSIYVTTGPAVCHSPFIVVIWNEQKLVFILSIIVTLQLCLLYTK